MRFWLLTISSAAFFGLATTASAGITVGVATTALAPLGLVALGLTFLTAAVCQPGLAPAPVAQRRSRS
ncbi:MAG: hypothetical protein JO111_15820 [Caulobacteraceae bacterium]|nr:hypothetical protein [Caulobacteraceae bacterium]